MGLSALFALFYFIQGISEPTAGLVAQPVLSLLRSWGQSAAQIGTFSALLVVPWAIKPVYGLLSDLVPLAGYHRKSYLIIVSAAATLSLLGLYALGLPSGSTSTLFWLMLVATVGVAFSDIVIDALMVTLGQPRGLTGRLQAAQWGAIYAATILSGSLGGYLSEHGLQRWAFLICGAMMLGTVALAAIVPERRSTFSAGELRGTLNVLRGAVGSGTIVAVGAFMFCWNFNPFLVSVLYLHMTREMGLTEQFFGDTESLLAVGAMAGSLSYWLYCRRLPMKALVHVSIVMGIVSTLAYWALRDAASARWVSLGAGFATATATVIQLDLAAQVCPPRAAGTLFALLMALANLGTAVATWFGGWCYEATLDRWGSRLAFDFLVGVGALATAGCWLIVPFLKSPLSASGGDGEASA